MAHNLEEKVAGEYYHVIDPALDYSIPDPRRSRIKLMVGWLLG